MKEACLFAFVCFPLKKKYKLNKSGAFTNLRTNLFISLRIAHCLLIFVYLLSPCLLPLKTPVSWLIF